MTNDTKTDGTSRGVCNECESVFALIDVNPDKMACPECGSRNWANEPRSLHTEMDQ